MALGPDDRGGRTVHRRRLGDLRPRQRRRHRRGAPRHRRRPADLARPERADHGPCRDRLCQDEAAQEGDGRHLVHRAGGDEHDHRCGARARESLACPADPGRCLRQSPPRSGPAADRGLRRRHGLRQRLLPTGRSLLRPDHQARAPLDRAPPRPRRDDGSAERRAGRPRLLPGRPGGELRLSGGFLRAPHLAHPPARARSARGRRGGGHDREGLQACDHLRRRGAVLRSRGRAGRLRRAPQHPVRRDPGRQGRARRRRIPSTSARRA